MSGAWRWHVGVGAASEGALVGVTRRQDAEQTQQHSGTKTTINPVQFLWVSRLFLPHRKSNDKINPYSGFVGSEALALLQALEREALELAPWESWMLWTVPRYLLLISTSYYLL